MDTTTRDCKICGEIMDSIYQIDEGICDECRDFMRNNKIDYKKSEFKVKRK